MRQKTDSRKEKGHQLKQEMPLFVSRTTRENQHDVEDLQNTINQLSLTCIRHFTHSCRIHILFRSSWDIPDIDLCQATSQVSNLKKLKLCKIGTLTTKEFSSKSATERNLGKSSKVWKSSNPFRNHPWPKEGIIRKKKYFEQNEIKTMCRNLRMQPKLCLEGNVFKH